MAQNLTDYTCPFQLSLNHPTAAELQCHATLRHLPGRRLVCSGTWNGEEVVVKLFLGKRALRYWNREKRGIDLLLRRGIATPALLFAGTLADNTPALITRMVTGAKTAQQRWEHCNDDAERIHLLLALTEVIAQQHKHGLWQEDLHLGNFLLCADEVLALDGDAIRAKIEAVLLPQHISRRNLALFLAQIPPIYEYLFADILKYYTTSTGQSLQKWKSLLATELPQQRRRRRHAYVAKAFRTCSEFTRQREKGQLLIQRNDAPEELVRQLQNDPDVLIRQGAILKDGNSATVVRVKVGEEEWVVKRYNIKSPLHLLKRCLRPTRASISWRNAHRLKISGINTPQPVAMLEKHFGPLRFTGYYVCCYIEAPSVAEYFSCDGEMEMQQSPAAHALVQMFEILFQLGIHHGDCKASNFLLKEHTPWIIDLDAMGEFRWRTTFLRYYQEDRERFLRNWADNPALREWFDKRLPHA
jgi:tRNA A-37 threonylcarbamoyl transferase component Bud32